MSQFFASWWPKYWSFSFSINPSNEFSGLRSFRTDWFDLLAVQGTLKGLLKHHNLKALTLQHSAFFVVQLSHLYMTTGNHSFDYTDLCQQRDVSAFYRRLLLFLFTQSCLTLCTLMDCSKPGSFVLHCFSEFAQIHVH